MRYKRVSIETLYKRRSMARKIADFYLRLNISNNWTVPEWPWNWR